jgi:uncharacterized membrane protein YhaH (DUF805 family)
VNWYLEVFRKYATFDGRARRAEYWYFALFNLIFSSVLGVLDGIVRSNSSSASTVGLLGGLYSLAVLIPSIAVGVRRLHDTGRSGWWMLIGFIPLIGAIWLLVYFVEEGTAGPNQYGADPKAGQAATAVTAAAWFPDPMGRHQFRYWNGAAWTADVSDGGVNSIDPL